MSPHSPAQVLIVGAGSMGVITGYDLTRAGAKVTFLVRPHRLTQLNRPQALYSYDEQSLTHYDDYDVITDPAALAGTAFDVIVITLDGAALQAPAGQHLTEQIGRHYRETTTAVVLGSVGFDIKDWFLQHSGLEASQVVMGLPGALIHEVGAAQLPVHKGVDADLLARADYAYRHLGPAALTIDDSAPQVTEALTAAFSGTQGHGTEGRSVATTGAEQMALANVASFPLIAAWELLGWPDVAAIDPQDPTWQLGARATREVQRLDVFGAAGRAAAEQTDAAATLAGYQQLAQASLPLDFTAFTAYHHGGKVRGQDHDILRQALARAEADGQQAPALRELVAQLPDAQH